eukprot:TRINITY_DN27044_c0_g4_i2.p1 TRINITY_DN27044_c0_g4~~TRINITY_DN27044_c0_g4_i2.p1  ORF type:complete len:736 (+),score=75.24 TRINITY_DN27044_c0_g4_i2:1335-3542(+)
MGVQVNYEQASTTNGVLRDKPWTSAGASTGGERVLANAARNAARSQTQAEVDQLDLPTFSSAESPRSFSSARSSDEGLVAAKACDQEHPELDTDLNVFHPMATFGTSRGHFAKVKVIERCCRGDGEIELHHWRQTADATDVLPVVVKRVKETRVRSTVGRESNERVLHDSTGGDRRCAEDTLNEIGVYRYLATQQDMPQFLLKLHDVFLADESVWIVLEHANGGDLFDAAKRGATGLAALETTKVWMWQILVAIRYLHEHQIGHRDLSIENVLLHNGVVRVMDFGQAVRSHSAGHPLRYFCDAGKPCYRSPESYVPKASTVEVIPPFGVKNGGVCFVQAGRNLCEVRLPEGAVPGLSCRAVPWGYQVKPLDMFAFGVCCFMLLVGMPPWREAKLADDHFSWVRTNGIAALLASWGKNMSSSVVSLLVSLLKVDPTERLTADECLRQPIFSSFQGQSVPVHFDTPTLSTSTSANSPSTSSTDSVSHQPTDAVELCWDATADACRMVQFMAEVGLGYASTESSYACVTNPRFDGSAFVGDAYCLPDVKRGDSMPLENCSSPNQASICNSVGDPYGNDCFYSFDELKSSNESPEPLTLQRYSHGDMSPLDPVESKQKTGLHTKTSVLSSLAPLSKLPCSKPSPKTPEPGVKGLLAWSRQQRGDSSGAGDSRGVRTASRTLNSSRAITSKQSLHGVLRSPSSPSISSVCAQLHTRQQLCVMASRRTSARARNASCSGYL